jgi:predicted nucleotidyltransferase
MTEPAASLRFGLKESTIARINGVFATCPEVERVILYGSRAKGNFRQSSDIDLTLEGDAITAEQFSRIALELDDLLLPYTIDLSLKRQIDNPDLLAHIERVGVVFYERDDYDELVYRKSFLDSVDRGLADAESGRTYRTEEVRAALAARRNRE